MRQYIAPIVLIAAVAAGAAEIGRLDHAGTDRQAGSLYCEMVARWDRDAARGVPMRERSGWPDYRGRYECRQEATRGL